MDASTTTGRHFHSARFTVQELQDSSVLSASPGSEARADNRTDTLQLS